jgi:hypothetical protein
LEEQLRSMPSDESRNSKGIANKSELGPDIWNVTNLWRKEGRGAQGCIAYITHVRRSIYRTHHLLKINTECYCDVVPFSLTNPSLDPQSIMYWVFKGCYFWNAFYTMQ